jgi:ketosteroid isomerase-like protein
MSQENVEVVRQAFTAFNDRAVEELVQLSDPDCEWLPFRAQLEGMTYRGHAGVRQFVSDMDEDWEVFRIDPLEFHDRDERVMVVGRVKALGRGSGVDVDSVAGFVFELRAGRVAKIVSYSDPAAALEVMGPRE